MTSRWTREYMTGEPICAICGAPKNGKEECCQVAPFVTFDNFLEKFFTCPEENTPINRSIAREFYDDYLHSNYASLDEYLNSDRLNYAEE